MVKKQTKGKSSTDHVVVKHHHIDDMHTRMAIAGAAIVFVVVLLFAVSYLKPSEMTTTDQLVYLSYDTCQSCATLESTGREAAQLLDIPFIRVNYNREVPFPGYMLIYKGVGYISGFQTESELWTLLCGQTTNQEICGRQQNQQAIDSQTN